MIDNPNKNSYPSYLPALSWYIIVREPYRSIGYLTLYPNTSSYIIHMASIFFPRSWTLIAYEKKKKRSTKIVHNIVSLINIELKYDIIITKSIWWRVVDHARGSMIGSLIGNVAVSSIPHHARLFSSIRTLRTFSYKAVGHFLSGLDDLSAVHSHWSFGRNVCCHTHTSSDKRANFCMCKIGQDSRWETGPSR